MLLPDIVSLALSPVSFQVLAPTDPISAVLGGTVLLRCHLSPALSAQAMQVKWSRPRLGQDVHVYRTDGSEEQGVEYWGRTELLRDGMQSGSVGLRIRNLTLRDEGHYLCDFQSDTYFSDAALELHVTSSGSDPLLHVSRYEGPGLRVTCLSSGWYPEPSVLWRNSHEKILNPESEQKLRSANGLFNVSSSVVVTESLDPALTCKIKPGSLDPEKISAILLSGELLMEQEKRPGICQSLTVKASYFDFLILSEKCFVSTSPFGFILFRFCHFCLSQRKDFFPRISYWWVAVSVILTIIGICFLILAASSLWKIFKKTGKASSNPFATRKQAVRCPLRDPWILGTVEIHSCSPN
uniref:Ig-like domain-containing protein n=1 Tax=Pelusios castaneus TaxID=367368 RepID=A0A8C8SEU5_9SAUR